ncbi:MAG TPA: hypothetical protein VMW80_08460 [Candidatus Dormibacteraeota bacterium]|nr:hypothetical protein [Candidatus Dormibacteraeota bacterium]
MADHRRRQGQEEEEEEPVRTAGSGCHFPLRAADPDLDRLIRSRRREELRRRELGEEGR